jgi:hypothetical protein
MYVSWLVGDHLLMDFGLYGIIFVDMWYNRYGNAVKECWTLWDSTESSPNDDSSLHDHDENAFF